MPAAVGSAPRAVAARPGSLRTALVRTVLSHLLLGIFALPILALLVGLILREVLAPTPRDDGEPRPPRILGLLLILVAVPVIGALAVPLKVAIQLALPWFGGVETIDSAFWRHVLVNDWVDAFLGASGLVVAVLGLTTLGVTWTKLRQVKNLPTSRARSAATGLVELRGIARAATWEPKPHLTMSGPPGFWKDIVPAGALLYQDRRPAKPGDSRHYTYELARPFVLEDATGQILIDPRGAKFGGFSTMYVFGEPPARLALSTTRLMEGDPVYVVGAAEVRKDAPAGAVDAERLVIRAVQGWRPTSRAAASPMAAFRSLFGKRQVFLLADREESDVRQALEASLIESCGYALVMFAAALWLLR